MDRLPEILTLSCIYLFCLIFNLNSSYRVGQNEVVAWLCLAGRFIQIDFAARQLLGHSCQGSVHTFLDLQIPRICLHRRFHRLVLGKGWLRADRTCKPETARAFLCHRMLMLLFTTFRRASHSSRPLSTEELHRFLIGGLSFFGHVRCFAWLLASPVIRQIHMPGPQYTSIYLNPLCSVKSQLRWSSRHRGSSCITSAWRIRPCISISRCLG